MKQLLLLGLLLCQINLQAQNAKTVVPPEVKAAFKQQFPDRKATWLTQDDGFEADFVTKFGAKSTVSYDRKGHFEEIEVVIDSDDLPSATKIYLAQKYSSAKITEATRNVNDKNAVSYEVQVAKGKKTYELTFDSNGNYIK